MSDEALTEAIEAALDAYAERHDGGTTYGAAVAAVAALRAAPPDVVAAALGWEQVGTWDDGRLFQYPHNWARPVYLPPPAEGARGEVPVAGEGEEGA